MVSSLASMSYAKGKKVGSNSVKGGFILELACAGLWSNKKGDINIFGKNKFVKICFMDKYFTFFVVIN